MFVVAVIYSVVVVCWRCMSYVRNVYKKKIKKNLMKQKSFEAASQFYRNKCLSIPDIAPDKKDEVCTLPPDDIMTLSQQHNKLAKTGIEKYTSNNLKPVALRCMDMMLWGQMNTAVYVKHTDTQTLSFFFLLCFAFFFFFCQGSIHILAYMCEVDPVFLLHMFLSCQHSKLYV
jgi:hypothetical protein